MFRTYQMAWGFITINLDSEPIPDGFISYFDITDEEAMQIMGGGNIEIVDDGITIDPVEVSE